MTCISCKTNPSKQSYLQAVEENFELRNWVKKEIVFDGTELYHIDKGTIFEKGSECKDTGAITVDSHLSYDGLPSYHTGSIGYNHNITYVGIHCCAGCKCNWWVELKKKNDLHIVNYVGPFQDACNQAYDLEATVTAKILDSDVAQAFQEFNLANYILIASKTDLFEKFYSVHLNYFEIIKVNEGDQMVEFFKSDRYSTIQSAYFVRSEWEDFIKHFSRKKKKKK